VAGRKLRSAAAVALLLAGFLVAGRPLIAHAAAFTVNTTADTPDANPGDGICADAAGHCSLHAAIDESNTLGGTNQVTLPAGTYLLSLPGARVSNSNLTITGAGASTTIIDGNHSTTVGTPLSIFGSGGLHISGVTIQNGAASGIANNNTLTVDSSFFKNNVAAVDGGGISNFTGIAAITNSWFTGNSVTQNNGFGGGGLSNRGGTLTVTSSTLDHNTSAGYGGAIATWGGAIITNVTITANTASDGAGISTGTGSTTIQSSTIDGNAATPYGGGIEAYQSATTKYVQIKNTIISGNTATSQGANCFGFLAIASQGYNIDGGTTCQFAATGDQSNSDPQLGPLQNNGGPTLTQAIGTGSPALDKGSPDCPPPYTDQRGSPRPMGPACDVGAYEFLPFPSASLPAVMNNAYGGYTTTAYIRNTGSAPAAVNILYYDQNGALAGTGDWTPNLAPNATWTVLQTNGHSFTSGNAGSAIVYSNQPIASFVNEFHASLDASSYTGIPITMGGSITLWAPAIANNAYGGYTTGIGLINQSPVSTDVTVTYRNGAGAVVATQALAGLAPHAYRGLYSGDATLALPSGFAGTATLQSSSGQISAVVNETGPGGQFSSYDAVSNSSVFLYAPVALNNAYGGYFTGMGIQNTTSLANAVGVTYYDAAGVQAGSAKNFSIPAYGYLGVYQGSATDGPPSGAYTARITSVLPMVAIVNETAPITGPSQQSTGYNTFPAGAATLNLPLVESAGADGWSTGEGIMNTGSATTTVTVTYYDTATGLQVGTAQTHSLPPFAFWGLYQPAGGLPSGARAAATVTVPSGSQVAVVCNESNATSFMSYIGQ